MAVGASRFGFGTTEVGASRSRASDDAREARAAAAERAEARVSGAVAPFGALSPKAAEAKRPNDLVASAKAAAMQVVTRPVGMAASEQASGASEMLDKVGFRTPAYEAAASYAAATTGLQLAAASRSQTPAVQTPNDASAAAAPPATASGPPVEAARDTSSGGLGWSNGGGLSGTLRGMR